MSISNRRPIPQNESINAIRKAINAGRAELFGPHELSVVEGTLAARLHEYYNQMGMKEGWLRKEYATPLSEQDRTNQEKNKSAAKGVLDYWGNRFASAATEEAQTALKDMILAAKGPEHFEGNNRLRAAANAQHEIWKRFVEKFQPERITPGHEKFREENYKQYNTPYEKLPKPDQTRDNEVVHVVTRRLLENAGIKV